MDIPADINNVQTHHEINYKPVIEVYTTNYCPYCTRAKGLLKTKQVDFTEIDVTNDEKKRTELVTKAGGSKTVPQIFINGKHIGGCDDLYKLDKEHKLDDMLKSQ